MFLKQQVALQTWWWSVRSRIPELWFEWTPHWFQCEDSSFHDEVFWGIWNDHHTPSHVWGSRPRRALFLDKRGDLRVVDEIFGRTIEPEESGQRRARFFTRF